VRVRTSRFS